MKLISTATVGLTTQQLEFRQDGSYVLVVSNGKMTQAHCLNMVEVRLAERFHKVGHLFSL